MSNNNLFKKIVLNFFKSLFTVKENKSVNIGEPKKILVIRQHNQFGDLLACISLFRAIKVTHPYAELTVILSPVNYFGVDKCRFINRAFIFDKKKIFIFSYFRKLWSILRDNYDIVIVPVTVSISSTSCMLARFSNSKIRIGANSLDGIENQYNFLFDRRVKLNWQDFPERHVADFGLDIVRPFGISTQNFKSQIDYTEDDKIEARDFIARMSPAHDDLIVGVHIGAGKKPNCWAIENFVKLITRLDRNYNIKFYLTGSSSDKTQLDEIEDKLSVNVGYLINKPIPILAAVIAYSNLFITNDTGVMHVAGATKVNQISLFGPTNPNNWAPIGDNKIYVKKEDDINSITMNAVFEQCLKFLN